jgi:hypothetical protein
LVSLAGFPDFVKSTLYVPVLRNARQPCQSAAVPFSGYFGICGITLIDARFAARHAL